jgi:hypothetical protein
MMKEYSVKPLRWSPRRWQRGPITAQQIAGGMATITAARVRGKEIEDLLFAE